jgi:hypothetical protein
MMRRQTTSAWAADTDALLDGEPGKDTDTGELAIGDGTRLWAALPKFIPDAVATVAGRTGNIVLTSADLTDRTTLGGNWFTMSTPAGVRFARINADGSITLRTAAELASDLGAGSANGLATLDGSGYIPTSQLPSSIVGQVEYQGTWSASANSPAIPAAAAGNKGHYYIATTAVSSSHGYSNVPAVDFAVGDWIISSGSAWSKVDNTDAVATVAGRTGSIVLTSADLTDRTTLGANWFAMSTPAGVRFARINADGSITQRTAAELVSDLSLTIGTNVQAYSAQLAAIVGLSPSNDDVLQRKAGAWTNRTIAQLKSDLAYGTAAMSNASDFEAASNTIRAALAATFATTSATSVDVSGLSITLPANGTYVVIMEGAYQVAGTTTGGMVALTRSGSPTAVRMSRTWFNSPTGSPIVHANCASSDDNNAGLTSSTDTANADRAWKMEGVVITGASPCTLQVRVIRGGTSANISIMSGSSIIAYKIA